MTEPTLAPGATIERCLPVCAYTPRSFCSSSFPPKRVFEFSTSDRPHGWYGQLRPTRAQLEAFVHDVVKAIGPREIPATNWDSRRGSSASTCPTTRPAGLSTMRLPSPAKTMSPLRSTSMIPFLGERKDLLSNPTTSKPRTGNKFRTPAGAPTGPPPHEVCAPDVLQQSEVQAAVRKRASLIGGEVRKELDALKTAARTSLCRPYRRMGDLHWP